MRTDPDLMNFYTSFAEMSPEDLRRHNWRPSRERYNEAKGSRTRSPKKRALNYLYVNKRSYGCKGQHYCPHPTKTCSLRGVKKLLEDPTKHIDKLKDTNMRTWDYKKTIRYYDSPDTFFYLDPPFHGSGMPDVYAEGSQDLTPEELKEALDNIKGKWLLSYRDSPEIRKLFKGYNIKTLNTKYEVQKATTGQSKPMTELLISNYDTDKVRKKQNPPRKPQRVPPKAKPAPKPKAQTKRRKPSVTAKGKGVPSDAGAGIPTSSGVGIPPKKKKTEIKPKTKPTAKPKTMVPEPVMPRPRTRAKMDVPHGTSTETEKQEEPAGWYPGMLLEQLRPRLFG